MTTVVYRDGVLASDSRVTCNDTIERGAYQKVYNLRDGSLFGWCGSMSDATKMLAYIEADADTDEPMWKGDTTVISVDPKGRMWVNEGEGVWLRQKGKFGAWGSGSPFAYGALEFGADAVQAVKVARKFDGNTGGPVRTVRLHDAD